jgi:CTP synthase
MKKLAIHNSKETKYIFVSGGVISGLGKGTCTASIGLLLKSSGYKVSALKVDMYLNIDAGTMNPVEHGEVFVTEDGLETDQDLGNYERYLSTNMHRHNYMTMGQVYYDILTKERELEYCGKTVQGHIQVPEEIISRIEKAAEKDKVDVMLIEVGGTVGEYQNVMFFEAIRRFKQRNPKNVFLVHLVYLITPGHLGEMKSKPAQASIYELYKLGLSPDLVICRSDFPIDKKRLGTLSFNTGVPEDHVFVAPNITNTYELPLIFEEQGLDTLLLNLMSYEKSGSGMSVWKEFISSTKKADKKVTIAILGKYFGSGNFCLRDSYLCVIEAIKHAGWSLGAEPEILDFNVEDFEDPKKSAVLEEKLKSVNGVIVPQGWGSRGVEGKIKAIKFLRTNKIPFLGLCFGMQMAVIEYARDVLGLKDANTTEANPGTSNPVIYVMPNQEEYLKNKQFGGTIRLGSWPCKLKEGTLAYEAYQRYGGFDGEKLAHEIHRHRYEVNNKYKEQLSQAGLIISGTSPDGLLAESIELPTSVHPFFLATQFHPEYKSWPLRPHPLFIAFIKAASQIFK